MIDLHLFCAPESDHRPYLKSPFELNGCAAASMGSVLVILDKPVEGCTSVEMPDFVSAAMNNLQNLANESSSSVVSGVSAATEFERLPQTPCAECSGAGFHSQCKECGDSGEVHFSNDFHEYSVSCDSCNGDPSASSNSVRAECGVCEGAGVLGFQGQFIFGKESKPVESSLLQKIRSLPNAQFYKVPDNDIYRFSFDGGCGVVAPMFWAGGSNADA